MLNQIFQFLPLLGTSSTQHLDNSQQLLIHLQNQHGQLFQSDLNIQGFLDKLVIKDGKLYINNAPEDAKDTTQEDGKVFISSIDLQGLQMQYDNIMQQYLKTPNGQEYQDAKVQSALKHGIDSYNNFAPGDDIPKESDPAKQQQVDQILQQIHKEFMNLESLRLAFDQELNPDPKGEDESQSAKLEAAINAAKKGLGDFPIDSTPPVEELEEHRTPLSSHSTKRTSEHNLPNHDAVQILPDSTGIGSDNMNTQGSATQEQNGKKPAGGHIGGDEDQVTRDEVIDLIKQQQEDGQQQQIQRQQELLQRQFERHQQLMQQAAKNQAAQRAPHPVKEENKDEH